MVKKFICLDCNYTWNDLDHDGCTHCKSPDVISDGEAKEPFDFDNGFFEGDFPIKTHYHQDDSGE